MDLIHSSGKPVLFSIGINHTTAPVEVREKIYLEEDEIHPQLLRLREHLSESLLLSTCNRTELYGVPLGAEFDPEMYVNILLSSKETGGLVRKDHFYTLLSDDAAEHLFRVASSIDSMVIGDSQIIHQVKDAYSIAQKTGSSGKIINQLCQKALHAAKRAKTETSLFEGAISVSYAAVELALKIFGELNDKNVLVIGAGETAQLTAESLIKKHANRIFITNRTEEHAAAMLENLKKLAKFDGEVIPFGSFGQYLKDVDIIISSTGSHGHVLSADVFKKSNRHRSGSNILIIDIAVPRDIDPEVRKFSNVFLKNIDDLRAIVDLNFEKRRTAVPEVEKIIKEEISNYLSWFHSMQLVPTIKDIENKFEQIRNEEILKNSNGMSAPDKEKVEEITRNIVQRILRTTIPNLTEVYKDKRTSEDDQERSHRLKFIRRLFGLEKAADAE